MSLNAYGDDKGAMGAGGASGLSQAPRLRAGGYAAWKPDMDVHLARIGADGVHKRAMSAADWQTMVDKLEQWKREEAAQYLADIGIGSSSGSSSGGSAGAAELTDKEKATRKYIRLLAEQSTKAYGALWSALPEELRAQARQSVPENFAYGLAHWLETKLQSTEQDNVGELLAQWVALRQEEDESFDAYRARVNHVLALLDHAKEKPSARQHAFMLLDRLQPRYRPAVLALKLGDLLKKPDDIEWDKVAAFVNQHERNEQRMGAEGPDGAALVAAAVRGSDSSAQQPRGASNGGWTKRSGQPRRGGGAGDHRGQQDRRVCFRCDEQGHVAAVCPNPPKAAHPGRSGKGAAGPSRGAGAGGHGSQRADAATRVGHSHSSDEESDDDRLPQRGERVCATLSGKASRIDTEARGGAPGARSYADVVKRKEANQQSVPLLEGPGCSGGGATPAAATPVREESRAAAVASTPRAAPLKRAAVGAAGSCTAPPSTLAVPAAKSAAAPPALMRQGPPVEHVAVVTRLSDQGARSTPKRKAVPLDAALADDAWGWDSMASSCCSGNRARFVSLRKCAAVPVKVADGGVVLASHIGSVALRVVTDSGKVVRIVVDNVLYHERFSSNLLSSELLTKKLGWQHHSTPEESYVITPGGHRVTLSTRGRVAVLMSAGPERVMLAQAGAAGAARGADADPDADALVRLHEKMAHRGWTRMIAMLNSGRVLDHGIDLKSMSSTSIKAAETRIRECTACVQGKATRTPFGHRGLDRGTQAGECLHMDTYQVKVERDSRVVVEYGLVIKDMYSGYMWHAQLQSKDEVADHVATVVRQSETQFGCTVKRLYADGGTEFINQKLKAFCSKHGKELRWTPARTQQLNGAAERAVRTFKDYERTMVQHAGAPLKLWGRAGWHAAYVWNRTHISKDTGMTPYEAMRGKKPSLRHINVWGCDAYCHVPKEQRRGLDPKAEPCIYLGHNDAQNAAYVLLLSTRKVITSRDLTYRSGSFTFMHAIARGDDGVRDALAQVPEMELRSENDGEPDSLPAQGGQEDPPVAASSGSESDSTSDPEEEYVVESIVGQRRRNGRLEFKVHWAGCGADEDSWEPESAVSDLAAMDAWQAGQRRSKRLETVPKVDYDEAEEEPQVHMAMCALRQLQLPEERPELVAAMSAVATGIAALEAQTPQTYRQAMASPDAAKWKAALDKEMRSCTEQQVWTLVRRDQLPPKANVLPCKEVFKLKLDEGAPWWSTRRASRRRGSARSREWTL